MVAFTTFALSTAFLAGLTAAAPGYIKDTGVKHVITAGFSGKFLFEPENTVAQIGDTIEIHFLPKNHSFVQSSFDKPCEPIDNAVFSGFQPTPEGEADKVFTFQVKDNKPFWFYCAQTNMNHCQSGMAGVINQNFSDNDKTLAKYKEAAAKVTTPSVSPPNVNGGELKPNPNKPGQQQKKDY